MVFDNINILSCIRFIKNNKNGDITSNSRTVKDYEIDLHISGNRDMILDGIYYKIDAPCCSVRKPGMKVTGIGSGFDCYCLTFSLESESPNESSYSRNNPGNIGKYVPNPIIDALPGVFPIRNTGYICEQFELLSHLYTTPNPNKQQIKLLSEKIILFLASESLLIEEQNTGFSNDRIKMICRYILKNYHSDLTVSGLAEKAGFSKEYFIRLFKKECNSTPHEYIVNLRLENAKYLLSSTNDNISDIALQCGYNSFSHFAQQFKNKFRLTPNEYRKSKYE